MSSREILDRLTRDSTAAIAAGMSYGQWKALHPHTEDGEGKKVKLCKICGNIIPPKYRRGSGGNNVVFCSYECSLEGKRLRDRKYTEKKRAEANARKEKLCKVCGKPIPFRENGSGRQRRSYCSDKCCFNSKYRNELKKTLHTGALDGM